MKCFAVAMVATMSLCGFFIQNMATDVVCYVCEAENLTACGHIIKIDIPGHDFKVSPPCDSTTSTCYSFNVKVDAKHVGVLRGCGIGSDDKVCDLVPSTYKRDGVCHVCSTERCNGGIIPNDNELLTPATHLNGQPQVTGFAVKCALISSLVVARMFFQTK